MSIHAYCSRNNVPYQVLAKWIRDVYKRVVPVQVTGTIEELKTEKKTCNDWTTGASGLSSKKGGPAMLNITRTESTKSRKFTDMRCKNSRILVVIYHQ